MKHHKKKNRFLQVLKYLFLFLLVIIIVFVIDYKIDTKITPPEVTDKSALSLKRETAGKNYYIIGKDFLHKNRYGLWEMYLEGDPFSMGVINGKLTRELIKKQEDAFVEQIHKMIPSKFWLRFVKYFIGWFNRDIDENIIPEYQQEIYGISFSVSDSFNYIAPPYERMLNYHAAHDIGHALQDLALVGCTSFAANLNDPGDNLIIGRNFDFYINDDFAKNKIVTFVKPTKGHPFVYITWASMTGVVSGMNMAGLTVTINAAKSDMPGKAYTPISLLAREILQYAGTIDEAVAIAKKRRTFVSEQILVGSAADNNAAVIEKSPEKQGLFTVNDHFIVSSNHFQSTTFKDDEKNRRYMETSASVYRGKRAKQLLAKYDTLDHTAAAAVLRDVRGLDGKDIGLGNEKAMCQLISHHSVIFEPERLRFWISTSPWQLGSYLEYDLAAMFSDSAPHNRFPLYDTLLTVPPDTLLYSPRLKDFERFRTMRECVRTALKSKEIIPDDSVFFRRFIAANPQYYQGYVLAGNYYFQHHKLQKAKVFFEQSLTKEFENTFTKAMVEARLEEIEGKR